MRESTAWKSAVAGAVLVGVAGFAEPAARVPVEPATVSAPILTPRRIGASMGAAVALAGAVIGGLALARSAGRLGSGNGRRGAVAAMVLAPIGLVSGALVVTTAGGGVGTGNGVAGGIVAMTVGAIGLALGGLALARSGRTG